MYQLVGVGSVSAQVGNIIGTFDSTLGIYLPLIVNFVQLIGNSLAIYLLGKIGRKTVTLIGNGCLGIINLSLAILFIYIDDSTAVIVVITVLLTLYMFIFGLTLGPVVWLYVPEIIPANNVPIATMHNWIAATAVFTLTPVIV
jgi:SP family arabinose:H+ symporter-like MFS transporter